MMPREGDQVLSLLMPFIEILNLKPLKEPSDKTRMFWTSLNGQALSYFEHNLRGRFSEMNIFRLPKLLMWSMNNQIQA
jgi:hypothetical protein